MTLYPSDCGELLSRSQQFFHRMDVPGFAVETEHRLGAGWADQEPGAVSEDILEAVPEVLRGHRTAGDGADSAHLQPGDELFLGAVVDGEIQAPVGEMA